MILGVHSHVLVIKNLLCQAHIVGVAEDAGEVVVHYLADAFVLVFQTQDVDFCLNTTLKFNLNLEY